MNKTIWHNGTSFVVERLSGDRHVLPPRCLHYISLSHLLLAHWNILQTTGKEGFWAHSAPILLVIVAIDSQELPNFLIQSLCLAIGLTVVSRGQTDIDIESFTKAYHTQVVNNTDGTSSKSKQYFTLTLINSLQSNPLQAWVHHLLYPFPKKG